MARGILDRLAKRQSAAWSDGQEPASLRIAQRIACTLQRESARAVLRRFDVGEREGGVGGGSHGECGFEDLGEVWDEGCMGAECREAAGRLREAAGERTLV